MPTQAGYLFEHLAVIFGATAGPLAARGKPIDLFGVIVLGLVSAMGGGTLRDVLLDQPVYWVHDSSFLLSAFVAAVLSFVFIRRLQKHGDWLQIPDAFSLAFVTMLGTARTLSLGHAIPVCVLMGVMTGVAGGMIRDVMLQEIPILFRPSVYLYATAAACGSIVFLAGQWLTLPRPLNLVLGAAVILTLRLAAIRWRIHLPALEKDL